MAKASDGPKWPTEEACVITSRVDTTDEAAYQEMLAGRLTRDEYTLVLNKNMERRKDWGTNS